MCTNTDTEAQNKNMTAPTENPSTLRSAFQTMQMVTAALFITTIALLISTVVLAVDKSGSNESQMTTSAAPAQVTTSIQVVAYENPCEGKQPDLPNVQCVIDAVEQTGEQSGANITKGYNGKKETSAVPLTIPYKEAGLCPVNVHWHLGAEHYSLGQFDETGECGVVNCALFSVA